MPVTHLPERCECCRMPWRTLFDVFVNGQGWRRYCAACADPQDHGGPRPYLGPYPVTSYRKPSLTVISADPERRASRGVQG